MGVKIADKLEQFNNGTYYLVDSSAVEYVDKDGNTKSVKDVLDNTPTDNSTHKTVIFENNIDMGRYTLLAKITNANYANNVIKFSCPNFKGQLEVGFKYKDDMDILKFELHFNTGSYNDNSGDGTTLKQHGLGLYSYPLNNPQNTAPEIKEAVRLYWDYSKGEIYVFLVDMMTAIPHCVLEYTGSGTLLRENTFVRDNYYNWNDGLNGTWKESNWKSIPYDKLETPPIYELGGDNLVTLTQAEYDALSDEEKNSDTVYFISDAKEEIQNDDSAYMPDMYDRNANGDMPVVPFDRLAYSMCLIQNTNLLNNGDTYDEDYVGGWVYTMANDILIKDKEMFNKIKVIVSIPGVLRIGIVNDKIFEANPRYSTCLVKWLVADFAAYTGLKEYDIEDTILEEGQYIFIECRQGESSWYYNQSNADVTQGKVTYPAQSCTSGLNVADKFDSTTHNTVFKSQSVTSKSAIFTFSGEINVGSKLRTNFLARGYDNTAREDISDVKTYTQSLYKGGLNVGLYRRTRYSDTRLGKCVENLMNTTYTGNNTARRAYAPAHQESLVGKSVYAFKIDVHTPGNLTIYHVKGKTVDTFEIIDKYTHYVRAKGLQTIHLPFDIKLKSEDEYIAFGGLHYKSTSSNIVFSECKWLYGVVPNWMKMGHNNGYIHLNFDTKSYPEVITEIGDYSNNTNTLNVELICRGEKRSPLEDKYISFSGDSITTYANFITTQAGVPAGNTAGDNAAYYPASGRTVNNIDATWWGILARDNRMQILRNDAWSGSRVSSSTGSSDTKCLCGTERYKFLENGSQGTNITYPFGEPEIVVNMIGTNDLSGNVELGEAILYGLSSPTDDDYKKILSAYSLMCQRFASYYNRQGAKVVHFLIPRGTGLNTYANGNGDSIPKLALEFERIAKSWGQYFIPLSYFTSFNMANYKALTCPTSNVLRDFRSSYFNGSDGLHPNVIGMETVADGVDRFLKEIV